MYRVQLNDHSLRYIWRYCTDHARKAIILRQKAHHKQKPTETADNLLEDLDHFKLVTGPDGVLEHQRQQAVGDNVASRALGKSWG